MPISYFVDREHRVVRTEGDGKLTEAEIVQVSREQFQDSEAEPGFDRLIDLRKVEILGVFTQSVRRWPEVLRSKGDAAVTSRVAIVASADAVFGMARMFEIAQGKSHFEVRVFRDMKPARDWLNLLD